MRECVIRPAKVDDMAAIAGIYEHFVLTSTATFEIVPPDAAEMARRLKVVEERGLPYLVATLEQYVVGYCYAAQFRPRAAYRLTVEDSIYVRADCIGYGVGKPLLGELIVRCQAAGCHRMVACICGENPASVALHRGLGFEDAGGVPEAGFKLEQWVDMAMMQRAL